MNGHKMSHTFRDDSRKIDVNRRMRMQAQEAIRVASESHVDFGVESPA